MRAYEGYGGAFHAEEFESFRELQRVSQARELKTCWKGDDDDTCQREQDSGDRTVKTGEEGRRLVLDGDDRFTALLKEARAEAEKCTRDMRFRDVRPKSRLDVVGGSVNVPRAMMGHPRAMSRRVQEVRDVKSVRVWYDTACPYWYSSEFRAKAGAAVMEVVRKLECAGYSVELNSCATFCDKRSPQSKLMMAAAPIKAFRTPLNDRKAAFPMMSESNLFHLWCWWMHRYPKTWYLSNEGVNAASMGGEYLKRCRAWCADHGGLFLPIVDIHNDGSGDDVSKMVAYVMRRLVELSEEYGRVKDAS